MAEDVLQSSCSICLVELKMRDKISALICGHIYHHRCVSEWIAIRKQCPSCRKPVTRTGFVEKLFFESSSEGGSSGGVQEVDLAEENHKLSSSLALEKEKVGNLESENQKLKTNVKSLEKKVLKEKEKVKFEIPRLKATIDQLTIEKDEQNFLKRELVMANNKLKACEFYKLLGMYTESAEKKIGEYLKSNGSLNCEKFFELQRAQNKELTEKRREAARENEKLKSEVASQKSTIQEQNLLIKTLKDEVLGLRDRANVQTPMQKKLKKIMDTETPAPAKRVSMGFDQSSLGDDSCYFKPVEPVAGPGPSSPVKPAKNEKIEEKSKDEENLMRKDTTFDDFSFDIPVPATIMKRAVTSRIPMTSSSTLKRSSTGNSEKLAAKKPKIASFFAKSSSSSKINEKTGFITLE